MSDNELDINLVLEHYGGRTKTRRSYMTHCLWHEDHTPSLSVNTEKNVWKCQSCGRGGDAYSLIMQMEDINFGRAREFAEATLGITAGGGGGGGGEVRSSRYSRSRKSPDGKRYRPRYRPRFSSGSGE